MSTVDLFAGLARALPMHRANMSATGATAGVDVRGLAGLTAFLFSAIEISGTDPEIAMKIQDSPDVPAVGAAAYVGTGGGFIADVEAGPDPVAETITITASSATSFAVVGSVSGALGTATVGVPFVSAQIKFTIHARGAAFVATDEFTVDTVARVWTDVPNAAFADGDFSRVVANADQIGRFVRGYATLGGVTPVFAVALGALGVEKK